MDLQLVLNMVLPQTILSRATINIQHSYCTWVWRQYQATILGYTNSLCQITNKQNTNTSISTAKKGPKTKTQQVCCSDRKVSPDPKSQESQHWGQRNTFTQSSGGLNSPLLWGAKISLSLPSAEWSPPTLKKGTTQRKKQEKSEKKFSIVWLNILDRLSMPSLLTTTKALWRHGDTLLIQKNVLHQAGRVELCCPEGKTAPLPE